MIRSIHAAMALAAGLCLIAGAAQAEDASVQGISLRVSAFPNAKVLPLHVGIEKGIFARRGLRIALDLTESSKAQRDGLAAGKIQVAHSALDNAVAMIEVGKQDVVIVSGGDSGMNEFFVQADVKSLADLRGRVLLVDAPDTAYALQLKKILLSAGLKDGVDYTIKPAGAVVHRFKALAEDKANAGAILNPPFSVQAEALGLRSLGRLTDLLGPYQAVGAFVLRLWARDNGRALENYLAAYIEALRWVRDPKNKAEDIALLIKKLALSPAAAERTYQLLLDPAFGFTPDAKFDLAGFRNMLALRAEIEGGAPAAPERYIDLGYYERAMQMAGR